MVPTDWALSHEHLFSQGYPGTTQAQAGLRLVGY